MSFEVKPYDAVEVGQARCFEKPCTWVVWSTKAPHERLMAETTCRTFNIAEESIGFVVGPMNEDGYFKMLVECGSVVDVPIDELLVCSRCLL